MPPALHGQFVAKFASRGGPWSMAGIVVAPIGVGIVSYAGHQKEEKLGGEAKEFNVMCWVWHWPPHAASFRAGFAFGF